MPKKSENLVYKKFYYIRSWNYLYFWWGLNLTPPFLFVKTIEKVIRLCTVLIFFLSGSFHVFQLSFYQDLKFLGFYGVDVFSSYRGWRRPWARHRNRSGGASASSSPTSTPCWSDDVTNFYRTEGGGVPVLVTETVVEVPQRRPHQRPHRVEVTMLLISIVQRVEASLCSSPRCLSVVLTNVHAVLKWRCNLFLL